MARLPDATALGAAPSAASGRQISTIDSSAIGQGMETMASGMRQLAAGQAAGAQGYANMGRGIAKGFDQLAETFGQDDELTFAKRLGDFTVEKIKLDGEASRETDPAKLETYGERYKALSQNFASQFRSPRDQQRFLIKTNDDLARSTQNVLGLVQQKKNEQELGEATQKVETYRKSYLEAQTPEARKAIEDSVVGMFEGLAQRGIISPQKAVTARQAWVKGALIDSLKMKPAEERLTILEGSRGSLKVRESSGDHTVENPKGFAGLYQFGAPRLQTLGVYQPGSSEDLKGWNDSGKNAPGKWSGTFNIPGFPNVKTKADFLANPAAQEAVYALDDQRKSAEIKSNGLDKYIGQTVGGVKITEEGIKNMIHLGGVGGASAFLTSGGVINRGDMARGGNATLAEYAKMGEAGKGSSVTSVLDPLEQKDLRDAAVYELMQKSRIADKERAQQAAEVEAGRVQRVNALEVGILDGTMGREDYLRHRQDGTITDADQMRKIEGMLAASDKRRQDEQNWREVWSGQRPVNPLSKDDRDIVEAGVQSIVRGSNGQVSAPEAALRVYERTGVLAESGVVAMRGALLKNDVDSVKAVGTIAANMMFAPTSKFPNANPRVFDGVQNGKELSEVGTAFNYLTNKVGLPADEAAKRIIEMNSPEYKKTFKVDDKEAEAFEKDLAKNAASEMAKGKFAGAGWFFDNAFTNNAMRNDIATTFATEAAYFYKKHGDAELAKSQAMDEMKKIYGVSNGALMKFPPENVYPPINGRTDYVYRHAADDVLKATGKKVEPKDVVLQEIPVLTAEGFRAKSLTTRYQVMYRTKVDGHTILEVLPAGMRWSPDVEGESAKAAKLANDAAVAKRNAMIENMTPPAPDVNPRSWKPGRPMKTPEKIAAETAAAQEATARGKADLRDVGTRSQAGGTGTADERNARIREGIAKRQEGEQRPSLPGVSDWLASTPRNPFKPDKSRRNTLPGGE